MKHDLFSGRTLEEALNVAARQLGVSSHSLGYEVINKPSGLFGKWFSSSIRVRVWVIDDSFLKEAARNAVLNALCTDSVTVQEEKRLGKDGFHGIPLDSRKKTDFQSEHVPELLKEFFDHLESGFGIPKGSVHYKCSQEGVEICLNSPDLKSVFSLSEKIPHALEHLTQRLSQKYQWPFKVSFNFGDEYLSQEQRLEELAKTSSLQVLKSGQPLVLPLTSSYERRLVHKTVASLAGVESKSSGFGANRRLIISPKASRPSHQNLVEESKT